MISAEAIKLIQETAQKAAGATVLVLPGEPHKLAIVAGGTVSYRDLPPENRSHRVATLDDLTHAVDSFSAGTDIASVWHCAEGIIAVLDADRRDCANMELRYSAAYRTLQGIKPMKQADVVRLLRHDLSGSVDPSLVPTFRAIDFKRRNDGSSEVHHGRESLGKQVEAIVTGRSEIPEEITVNLRVYANVDLPMRYPVVCTVEIDPVQETFSIRPLPDELTTVVQQAQAEIGDRLRKSLDKIPVFYGTP